MDFPDIFFEHDEETSGPETAQVNFFIEDLEDFEFPFDEEKISSWIIDIIVIEEKNLIGINYIFCSDPYLHKINVEYLSHDNLTDIITFPYNSHPNIEGDIFISVDRVRENASSLETSFDLELCRVMIHGVLHLCGYQDHSMTEKLQMREKEDFAIKKFEK